MKKKWILLGIFFLFISIIAIFTFYTLTDINTPKVTVHIDAVQLTEENVSLDISMHLDNENPYNLVLEDMTVEVLSSQNTVVGSLVFPKKTVPAHESITINSTGTFGFKGEPLEQFNSHITGDFGVNFFDFISVSLPLEITIITNPTPIIDTIFLPSISIDAGIEQVNETGVLLNGSINVDNQNTFSLSLSNSSIIIQHNNTPIDADINVTDTTIQPESKTPIYFSAFVGYEVFDNGTLSAALTGDVSIAVAGVILNRTFTASAAMNVPDLASYLMDNERIEISLSADFDITLSGVNMDVGFKLYNPTKIPLIASELDIIIYRVDNETKTIIAEDYLQNCSLPPKNETCLKTTFRLPIISFLPIVGDGIPDWFLLTLLGDFTIADSNQKIPVQINGYLSGNFLAD
ncbi:MAG: hypothetical protein R6U21_05720 [Thermoplasmatota archaeon]